MESTITCVAMSWQTMWQEFKWSLYSFNTTNLSDYGGQRSSFSCIYWTDFKICLNCLRFGFVFLLMCFLQSSSIICVSICIALTILCRSLLSHDRIGSFCTMPACYWPSTFQPSASMNTIGKQSQNPNILSNV